MSHTPVDFISSSQCLSLIAVFWSSVIALLSKEIVNSINDFFLFSQIDIEIKSK